MRRYVNPHCYNLPQEYTKLIAECSRQAADAPIQNPDRNSTVWICKPVGQSQGKGIYLFRNMSDLSCCASSVVQRYIQDPLLIAGYKFDLRLYVCVPSFHPLRVYLYREGLARFSTERFSLKNLDNMYCHLTNTSLNKQGPGYAEMKERVGAAGCKWTLEQLRRYFQQARIPDWLLWQRISQLVVLTVLSQVRSVPRTANCFEFYGFDVLIDSSMRPWLLEVNLSPALGVDCDADPVVKKPMLHDLFDLLGMPVCNTGLSLFRIWSKNTPPALSSQLHLRQRRHHQLQPCAVQRQPTPSSQSSSSNEGAEEDEEGSPQPLQPPPPPRRSASALTAATAAGVWRRRSQTACRAESATGGPGGAGKPARLSRASSVDGEDGLGLSARTPQRKKLTRVWGSGSLEAPAPPRAPSAPSTPNAFVPATPAPLIRMTARSAARNRKLKRCAGPDDPEADCAVQLVNPTGRPRPAATLNRRPSSAVWGNGRDWNRPPAMEGDWVRVYPTCDSWMASEEDPGTRITQGNEDDAAELVPVGDKEVKTIVAAVQRVSKVAREAYRKKQRAADEERLRFVCEALNENVLLWLPRC